MIELRVTGLDAVKKDVFDKLNSVAGTHTVAISEVLTEVFVAKHTKFPSVGEMFDASGFQIRSENDFSAIPDNEWDDFIRAISDYDSWASMLTAAKKEWVVKKLGLQTSE